MLEIEFTSNALPRTGMLSYEWKMRFNFPIATAFLSIALVGGAHGQAQTHEPSFVSDHPFMQIDIRKLGYERFKGGAPTPTFIDFTDDDHLAIAWVTLDNPSRARKLGPLKSRPAHLHAVILNTKTGNKESENQWPAPYLPVGFLPIPNGKILVCAGDLLRLFSPSLELIGEQKIPSESERGCWLSFPVGRAVSPSRRTALVLLSTHPDEMELLDTNTLAVLSKWTDERAPSGISDHWLTGECGSPAKLCLRQIDESWQAFEPKGMDQQLKSQKRKMATFVNDQTIVIEGGDKLAATTVEGEVLFQLKSPHKYVFGTPVVSAGGRRFAVIVDRFRGIRNPQLDMYPFLSNERATVYSVADGHPIYTVKLQGTSPWTPWTPHINRLALSPDGAHLAVLADELLKFYELPISNAEQR